MNVGRRIVGFVIAFFGTLVPGFASIYNPHQYEADPLFQPPALKSMFVVATVAVAVMWFFARRWSARTANIILVTGLALTVVAVVMLVLASMQPMHQAGPFLLVAQLSGNLAMPCVASLSVAVTRTQEENTNA